MATGCYELLALRSTPSPFFRPPARQYDVMVTAGANQAFTNVVLALLDASDRAVLFK